MTIVLISEEIDSTPPRSSIKLRTFAKPITLAVPCFMVLLRRHPWQTMPENAIAQTMPENMIALDPPLSKRPTMRAASSAQRTQSKVIPPSCEIPNNRRDILGRWPENTITQTTPENVIARKRPRQMMPENAIAQMMPENAIACNPPLTKRPTMGVTSSAQRMWLPAITLLQNARQWAQGPWQKILLLQKVQSGGLKFGQEGALMETGQFPGVKFSLPKVAGNKNWFRAVRKKLRVLTVNNGKKCKVPKIFVQGMLWGVKLGMLWGTIKSTFCHRSSPNHSYSQDEVYPCIKHDAESLRYNYVYDQCVVTGSNCG
jgi:hypothetical protein